MTDRDGDEDLARLVGELVTALRDLEDELGPPGRRGPRPPSPRELRRFTSEVAIPGLVLVLETNIRALRLLQRALELSETADRAREDARVGERAREASETTLDRLDDALAELQRAVEGRPDDDEAARLLDDARRLRSEVQTRLREYADERRRPADADAGESTSAAPEDSGDPVRADGADGAGVNGEPDRGPTVDVDAELASIKAELDDLDRDEVAGNDPDDRSAGDEGADDAGPDSATRDGAAVDADPDDEGSNDGTTDDGSADRSGSDGSESDGSGSDGSGSDGTGSDGTGSDGGPTVPDDGE